MALDNNANNVAMSQCYSIAGEFKQCYMYLFNVKHSTELVFVHIVGALSALRKLRNYLNFLKENTAKLKKTEQTK